MIERLCRRTLAVVRLLRVEGIRSDLVLEHPNLGHPSVVRQIDERRFDRNPERRESAKRFDRPVQWKAPHRRA